jgi:hypothetical protein
MYYLTPGRINIETTHPGIYLEGYTELFNNESVKYLVNSPHLKWQKFTWTKDCKMPDNAVTVKNPDIEYGIGRCSPSSFTHVGKVMSHWGFFYAYNGGVRNETSLEILVCEKI